HLDIGLPVSNGVDDMVSEIAFRLDSASDNILGVGALAVDGDILGPDRKLDFSLVCRGGRMNARNDDVAIFKSNGCVAVFPIIDQLPAYERGCADEIGHEPVGRPTIDFAPRSHLLDAPLPNADHTVGDRHG